MAASLFHIKRKGGRRLKKAARLQQDIAFALAIITMLGSKVPASLKIFLAALAIVDDLMAILVIAIFYSSDLNYMFLLYAAGFFLFLLALNKAGVKKSGILPDPWYFYMVFYTSFRSPCNHRGCAYSFCNSNDAGCDRITIGTTGTYTCETSQLYHYADFCLGQYEHRI